MARLGDAQIQVLEAALIGYGIEREQIELKIAEIRRELRGRTSPADGLPRRTMSAAGRRAIAAAQRKRWAEYNRHKAAKVIAKALETVRPKRKLSAAVVENLKLARAARAAKRAAQG